MITTANNALARKGGTLLTLQAGRGIAALAVVLHHAGQASDAFAPGAWGSYFDWGILGVDFFFVLSGFIIFHAHGADPHGVAAAGRFITKRLRRIYLPYLPISIGLIAAYLALPDLSQGGRDWGWFSSLILLPSGHPPALSVAWTLIFEMCFYLVFMVSFYARLLLPVSVGWAALVLLVWITGWAENLSAPLSDYWLNPLVLEFLLGMGAAWVFQRSSAETAWMWLCVGLVGIAVFALWPDAHRVGFGVALVPLVLGLALIERARRVSVPAALVHLGAASYALYLIHNPLMSLMARLTGDGMGWLITFVLCCVTAVFAGFAYHHLFERPVLKRSGRASPQAWSNERSVQ